jgi:hypothetical protein
MTKLELADLLDRFAEDQPDCGPWNLTILRQPQLEPYRRRLLEVEPPFDVRAIKEMALELRSNA